jgi:hypothetical protein
MGNEPIDYKKLYEQEQKKVAYLQGKIDMYEQNGPAKLFYSLNRKSWEMADLLNKNNLTDLDIVDAKDKSFDRLKVVWNDASDLAIAINALGQAAGITGNEQKDMNYRRRITTPETISDVLGNTAGQQD